MVSTLPISYSNVGQVLALVPDITSNTNVTSAVIASFMANNQAKVDAKLVSRYSLPFTEEIPVLQQVLTYMTLHDVIAGTSKFGSRIEGEDHVWLSAYKRSMKDLDAIAAGKMDLVNVSGQIVTDRADPDMVVITDYTDYEPTFQGQDLTESVVDPDFLKDVRVRVSDTSSGS